MSTIIIANRLTDGIVVFFGGPGDWTPCIDDGLVLEPGEQADRGLEQAKADEAHCLVIDPQLIDVESVGGRVRPKAIREAIRAFGPTVHPRGRPSHAQATK